MKSEIIATGKNNIKRTAISSNLLPIVLSGNCNSCLGTTAGIGSDGLGVVWFDAHGDFNTPETTISGFLDGMGLAMLTGRCWQSLLRTIPGFSPISEANTLHIGSRDLDPEEARLLQQSAIELITPQVGKGRILQAFGAALDRLRDKAARIYLHVDMDVLNTGEALPNHLAVPGGLSVEVVEAAISMVKERFELCAGAVTSFDPGYDKDDQVLEAGIRMMGEKLSGRSRPGLKRWQAGRMARSIGYCWFLRSKAGAWPSPAFPHQETLIREG